MKLCSNCNKSVREEAMICPYCKKNLLTDNNNNNDISDMRLNILVLLLPAIGLILCLIFRDDQPEKAAEVGCFALIGFIIEVVIGLFVLLFSNDSLVFN